MSLYIKAFPEVYMNGERPSVSGTCDKERYSFPTPLYGYGWVIPCAELHKAYFHRPFDPNTCFLSFSTVVNKRFYPKWKAEGLDKNIYDPNIPEASDAGDDYVFLYMACNKSKEEIDSIVENRSYHEEVRACLGYTETLKLEPAWFRYDVKGMPKGLKPDDIASSSRPWDNTLSFSLASRTLTLGPFTLAIGSISLKVRLHNVLARIIARFSGH